MANPRHIVDIAIKRGMQCIAIADHGNINGSLRAAEYVKNNSLPILIIISQEVKSKSGDILALNIKESIPEHLSAEESIKRIHDQGGLAIVAHPFGIWCGFSDSLEKYLGLIDGIEVLNASVFKGNDTALAFAKKHGLAFTAGSDAHFANHFIGKTWIDLPFDYSNGLTAAQVIGAIKEKKGTVKGGMASFLEKAIDHSFRTLAKAKSLFKNKKS